MLRTVVSVSVLAALLMGGTAIGKTLDPLPGQAKYVGPYKPAYQAPPASISGTWSSLKNAFPGGTPDTALLLTDGSVIMHDGCTRNWWRLRPTIGGSYINGNWTATAPMPSGYGPLYFASQVLPDGRVIVNGGEYNAPCSSGVWTNLGALFNPVSNTWTPVPAPSGWSMIGDAQSVVRADNKYMLATIVSGDLAIATISGTTVTWSIKTAAMTGKADSNDEEGWTHLRNRSILTVDANIHLTDTFSSTEKYDIVSNTWSAGPNTASRLVDTTSHEIGPGVLLPNGLVFQFGATSNTGIYKPGTNTWIAGPTMPNGNDSADGPAAVLPSGRVLAQLSPGVFGSPSAFYEVAVTGTGATFTPVSDPISGNNLSSYEGRMLVLPTGQVLWSSDRGFVEIYTPKGSPASAWRPTINSVATTLTRGSKNNLLQGKLLHGLSEGGYYGDDAQMSTNYPLIRFTNDSTHRVCYARTHHHSRMGVADTGGSSTKFDIPGGCQAGASTLEVVVNGIASAPLAVTLN
jgi:hypothetical protein